MCGGNYASIKLIRKKKKSEADYIYKCRYNISSLEMRKGADRQTVTPRAPLRRGWVIQATPRLGGVRKEKLPPTPPRPLAATAKPNFFLNPVFLQKLLAPGKASHPSAQGLGFHTPLQVVPSKHHFSFAESLRLEQGWMLSWEAPHESCVYPGAGGPLGRVGAKDKRPAGCCSISFAFSLTNPP